MEHRDYGAFVGMSPLQAWASNLHEMYQAMRTAGFSETEAISLITGLLNTTCEND